MNSRSRVAALASLPLLFATVDVAPAQAVEPVPTGGRLDIFQRFPAVGVELPVYGQIAKPWSKRRPMLLQKRTPKGWVTVDSSAHRSLIFTRLTPKKVGPLKLRVLAPRVKRAGRWLKATKTPAQTVRVVHVGGQGITAKRSALALHKAIGLRFTTILGNDVATVRDRSTGTERTVALPQNCRAVSVASDDGRYAAVTCDSVDGTNVVYLVDFVDGSVKSLGVTAARGINRGYPVVSGDGSIVAWSQVLNADPITHVGAGDLMVYSVATGETAIYEGVAGGTTGPLVADTAQGAVSVTADGRYVSFTSAKPLDPSDNNAVSDAYLLDRQTGSFSRAIETNGSTTDSWLSRDGRYLAFASTATRLTADKDLVRNKEIYLLDRTSNAITKITNGNGDSLTPRLNESALRVEFESQATNLVRLPKNHSGLAVLYSWTRPS